MKESGYEGKFLRSYEVTQMRDTQVLGELG